VLGKVMFHLAPVILIVANALAVAADGQVPNSPLLSQPWLDK
jgi:hypothetical protein